MNDIQKKVILAVREAIEECNDWKSMDKQTWWEVEDAIKDKIKDVFKQEGVQE